MAAFTNTKNDIDLTIHRVSLVKKHNNIQSNRIVNASPSFQNIKLRQNEHISKVYLRLRMLQSRIKPNVKKIFKAKS